MLSLVFKSAVTDIDIFDKASPDADVTHLIMMECAYRISKKQATIGYTSTKQASLILYEPKKEHSTVVAALELIDQISAKKNKGESPINTFVDLPEVYSRS